MKERPLRTTVIGSHPFPAWLEFACQHLPQFGDADRAELIDDAVSIAIRDQVEAGLDVITDGEQTRLDFNPINKNKLAVKTRNRVTARRERRGRVIDPP